MNVREHKSSAIAKLLNSTDMGCMLTDDDFVYYNHAIEQFRDSQTMTAAFY